MRIEPKKVITSGIGVCTATELVVVSEMDNLVDEVVFRAALFDENGAELAFAHIKLGASDYKSWDATSEGAHEICAAKLELKLL